MDSVPKPKRTYKKRDPDAPKRKYTKRIAPAPDQDAVVLVPEIKVKRKYTRRNIVPLAVPAPLAAPAPVPSAMPAPAPEPLAEPALMPPAIKPKRKYTRRKVQESLKSPTEANNTTVKKRKINIKTTPIIVQANDMPKLNEKFIELMDTLGFIMRKRKDVMRARAYANAKETIASYPGDITVPSQLKGMKGIGTTIYQKLVDFNANGTLRVMEEHKDLIGKKKAMDVFANIYGVGEKKAEELVDAGILTIEELELRQADVLNAKQRLGLKYYKDILQRIPRSEIQEYEAVFKEAFPAVADSKFEIVGSYRRGLATSGDIDVIITSSDPDVFRVFVDELVKRGIIVEILSRGNAKCLVIAKLPKAEYVRRVDFLYSSPEEYPFSVLYFTGSKEFNTTMRERALSMNYTLNEHGMSVMENRKKGDLVAQVFPDEKSIFDFLGMEYKQPMERLSGDAVVPLAGAVPVVAAAPAGKKTRKLKPKAVEPEAVAAAPEAVAPIQELVAPEAVVKAKPKPKVLKPEVLVAPPDAVVPKEVAAQAELKVKPKAKPKAPAPLKCDRKKADPKDIDAFKKDGIKVLESLTEDQLAAMITAANVAFHCQGVPIMTDNEFDIVRDYLQSKYPNNPALTDVGAEIDSGKNKIKLPYEMASMDKIKPDTNVIVSWCAKYKGPYVLSCKLDGVSGMFSTEGPKPKLYTRGDGTVGQDISAMIPKLKLPTDKKDIVVRGEFIIPKAVFHEKYADKFANPRNLVAGIVNQKTHDGRIEDLRFLAYEVIKPAGLKPSEQMALLETMNVDVVQHRSVPTISNEYMSEVLQDWRKNYAYEIDGVIVSDDNIHPRATGNPDHSFAFKMVLSDQMAESQVVDVIWTASKDGYLKPRVQIMPVKLGGVTIQFATGFNGSFIEENKIGIGAIVQIIRSGDVIPKIQSVTTPAAHAKMPSEEYVWNDTHVDVMLKDATGNTVVLGKNITGFFKGIGVDGMGPGSVDKLIAAGFDSVPKILRMEKADFLKVEGFQDKTATKLMEGIRDKVAAASLATIMAESNKLGRGFSTKRAEAILAAYPTVFEEGERNVAKLVAIDGIEKKSAEAFVSHIPEFLKFLEECGLTDKLKFKVVTPAVVDESHPLFGKTIVTSGFRDKDLEEKLKTVGAKMGSGVSKSTFALLVKDMNETSGKVADAKKHGVTIMVREEFLEKYLIGGTVYADKVGTP
jgi:DNA ligase (NAD+)